MLLNCDRRGKRYHQLFVWLGFPCYFPGASGVATFLIACYRISESCYREAICITYITADLSLINTFIKIRSINLLSGRIAACVRVDYRKELFCWYIWRPREKNKALNLSLYRWTLVIQFIGVILFLPSLLNLGGWQIHLSVDLICNGIIFFLHFRAAVWVIVFTLFCSLWWFLEFQPLILYILLQARPCSLLHDNCQVVRHWCPKDK